MQCTGGEISGKICERVEDRVPKMRKLRESAISSVKISGVVFLLCVLASVQGGCVHRAGSLISGLAGRQPRIRLSCYASSTVGTTYVDPENLGRHGYRNGGGEKNGIVYTCRGGHIDIAHLRKAADWTAFLAEKTFEQLRRNRSEFSFKFYEPSKYIVHVSYPSTWATDIFIDGDIAYLSDGQGACKIFDISDLPDVELVYELPDNGYWSHVYAANGSIFGIDQFFGIYIYNVLTEQIALTKTKPERPAEPTISAAHPNPFNAEATISFSLPERTDAELCVFDITGRKVITLIEDCLPAGDYNLRWRADDAPSGTYFAVLRTPNSRATEKLLLIK